MSQNPPDESKIISVFISHPNYINQVQSSPGHFISPPSVRSNFLPSRLTTNVNRQEDYDGSRCAGKKRHPHKHDCVFPIFKEQRLAPFTLLGVVYQPGPRRGRRRRSFGLVVFGKNSLQRQPTQMLQPLCFSWRPFNSIVEGISDIHGASVCLLAPNASQLA